MQKITKIDEYTISMVTLNYHHEWFVYFRDNKDEGIFYKTYKEAILAIADKINY